MFSRRNSNAFGDDERESVRQMAAEFRETINEREARLSGKPFGPPRQRVDDILQAIEAGRAVNIANMCLLSDHLVANIDARLPQPPLELVHELVRVSTRSGSRPATAYPTSRIMRELILAHDQGGRAHESVVGLLGKNAAALSESHAEDLADSVFKFRDAPVLGPEVGDHYPLGTSADEDTGFRGLAVAAEKAMRGFRALAAAELAKVEQRSGEVLMLLDPGLSMPTRPQPPSDLARKLAHHCDRTPLAILDDMYRAAKAGGVAALRLRELLSEDAKLLSSYRSAHLARNLGHFTSLPATRDELQRERLDAPSTTQRIVQAYRTSSEIVDMMASVDARVFPQTPRELAQRLSRYTPYSSGRILDEMHAAASQGGSARDSLGNLLVLDASRIEPEAAGGFVDFLMSSCDVGLHNDLHAAEAAHRLDEKTAADMRAARLDAEEIDKAGVDAVYNRVKSSMRSAADRIADEGTTVDIDAQFPLASAYPGLPEGPSMKYQAHATGFKEPNTGRQLYLRLNGSPAAPRLGIFDGMGNYVMDVDSDVLVQLGDHARSLRSAISDGSYSDYLKTVGRPQLGHGVADTDKLYPGMLLTESEINALSNAEIGVACSIEGIAIHAANPHVSQQRLREHFQAKRALIPADLREAAATLRRTVQEQRTELQALSSGRVGRQQGAAEAKRLSAGLAEQNRENNRLAEKCDRLSHDNRILQGQFDEAIKIASGKTASVNRADERLSVLNRSLRDALAAEGEALRKMDAAEAEAKALTAANLELTEANNSFAQLALTGAPNTENDTTMENTTDLKATPAVMPQAGALAPQPNAVVSMFTDALQLAAVQQSSKLVVSKLTPIMIKAGVPKEFAENQQVQGILELVLPFILSQYGDKIPGIKKMDALPALSQTQMVMGLAGVIGVSVQQLLGIGIEVIGSLNEGMADDKLKAAKEFLDDDSINQEPPAAKTGPQAV